MEYNEEIEKLAATIIDEKEYLTLQCILRNYDRLVKMTTNTEDNDLPYWSYCCCCDVSK